MSNPDPRKARSAAAAARPKACAACGSPTRLEAHEDRGARVRCAACGTASAWKPEAREAVIAWNAWTQGCARVRARRRRGER